MERACLLCWCGSEDDYWVWEGREMGLDNEMSELGSETATMEMFSDSALTLIIVLLACPIIDYQV